MTWTEEEYAAYLQRSGQTTEKPKRHKYNAKRTNGYASKHESDVAAELHMAELARQTVVLEQVPFPLPVNTKYIADFVILYPGGRYEIQDAKGVKTDTYQLKKRQMRELWETEIVEV